MHHLDRPPAPPRTMRYSLQQRAGQISSPSASVYSCQQPNGANQWLSKLCISLNARRSDYSQSGRRAGVDAFCITAHVKKRRNRQQYSSVPSPSSHIGYTVHVPSKCVTHHYCMIQLKSCSSVSHRRYSILSPAIPTIVSSMAAFTFSPKYHPFDV